jgi:hypothetical protein
MTETSSNSNSNSNSNPEAYVQRRDAFLDLSASEQSFFLDTLSRLFEEGFLWRDDDAERAFYAFVLRHKNAVEGHLSALGWSLVHHDRINMVQLVHKRGAHKRRLNKETTIWVLIARLIYAEHKESNKIVLTRNPVCTVGDFVRRYAEHFPGKAFRKKGSLEDALGQLQSLKLIRPAGHRVLVVSNSDSLMELLPALEIVVPAIKLKEALENLKMFADGARTFEEEETQTH